MRYIATLFDAPVPAAAAAAALVDAGFHPQDIATIPPLPDSAAGGTFANVDGDGPVARVDPSFPSERVEPPNPPDPSQLRWLLRDLGFDPTDAARDAEGVRRGAILLLVRAPTLSAPVAAEIITSLAPPDPDAMIATWEADPDLMYGWADVPAPVVGTASGWHGAGSPIPHSRP